MHEDELPADISDADYAAWYAKSWVLDGAGVRVGPVFAAVVAPADVPLPGHPEPHTHRWTALELEAIKQHREAYAKAAVAAERERCAKICDSVHADTGECPELALHCATRIRANQKGTV